MSLKTTTKTANFVTNRMLNTIRDTLNTPAITLFFNSRNNAELVKSILEWEDAHPNAAVSYNPTLTQPNEPLTIEQLREMDGEPVWGKSLITGKPGEWFILRVVEMSKTWFIACAGAEQGFGDKDTYGETWVAHRRPLEGEGKN